MWFAWGLSLICVLSHVCQCWDTGQCENTASLEPAKASTRSKRSQKQQCYIWNMFPNIYIYLHICNICILYRPLSPPPPGCHQQRGRHYGRFSRPIFHPILNLYQFIAIYTLSMGISDAHHHFVPRVESCSWSQRIGVSEGKSLEAPTVPRPSASLQCRCGFGKVRNSALCFWGLRTKVTNTPIFSPDRGFLLQV